MTESEILEIVHRAGLSRVANDLAARLQPSIRIVASSAHEERISPGLSTFGGRPDLPAGTPWPERDGRPLAFIGQLRLADIAPHDASHFLPASGLLSFFYDAAEQPWGSQASDQGGWRVLFHTVDPALLHPSPPPAGLGSRDVFEPCRLHFSHDVTLPPFCSVTVDSLGLTEAERQAYVNMELEHVPEARGGARRPVHRMLGHPDAIQGDMQLECQMVRHGLDTGTVVTYGDPLVEELKKGVMNWMLLLQVDSDEAPGWMWGDVGRIYFWIQRDAFLAGDFAKVWTILQCY
jgi:uncharacterized protein YwqG